ncbi:MAG: hypothetical protein QXR13_01455 [Candidatus Bathyarchaeia archaeon]
MLLRSGLILGSLGSLKCPAGSICFLKEDKRLLVEQAPKEDLEKQKQKLKLWRSF